MRAGDNIPEMRALRRRYETNRPLWRRHVPPDLCKLIDGLVRLIRRKDGQDLFEYALILGMLALAVIAGFSSVARSMATVFNAIIAALNTNLT